MPVVPAEAAGAETAPAEAGGGEWDLVPRHIEIATLPVGALAFILGCKRLMPVVGNAFAAGSGFALGNRGAITRPVTIS